VLKNILLVLALFYTVALAVVSLLSSDDLPSIDLEDGDKLAHAIAYGILCLIWYQTLKALKISKSIIVATFGAIIYGIILEVFQGTLTEARVPDVYDILANCIGVVFIFTIIVIKNKTQVKSL
jgi:VanZ family protein